MFVRVLHPLFLFAISELPYADRFVVRGRVEILACGVETEGAHPVVVTSKSGEILAGLKDEKFDQFVTAASK
jgi:hypothetical protein